MAHIQWVQEFYSKKVLRIKKIRIFAYDFTEKRALISVRVSFLQ